MRDARPEVDEADARAEHELDLLVRPECVGPEREVVARAGEELLRERRPLVGRVRLVPDDRHLAVEPLRSKRLGAPRSREPGADDEHAPHAACSSTT